MQWMWAAGIIEFGCVLRWINSALVVFGACIPRDLWDLHAVCIRNHEITTRSSPSTVIPAQKKNILFTHRGAYKVWRSGLHMSMPVYQRTSKYLRIERIGGNERRKQIHQNVVIPVCGLCLYLTFVLSLTPLPLLLYNLSSLAECKNLWIGTHECVAVPWNVKHRSLVACVFVSYLSFVLCG